MLKWTQILSRVDCVGSKCPLLCLSPPVDDTSLLMAGWEEKGIQPGMPNLKE
jgi:hypothetical protein